MQLQSLDWAILIGFFTFTLAVGAWAARRVDSARDYFLSGQNQRWWLLGTSMVATTFAADTPLLVTSIVREHGVAGNWMWWAFLLTGMLTVAVYAKLWRRSGVVTDVEFYELRYGGAAAAWLRGFRAV
jgi:Na+/proline symporter